MRNLSLQHRALYLACLEAGRHTHCPATGLDQPRPASTASLAKVFVVMNKVWQLPLSVDCLAGRTHRVSERAGAAAEDANFADLKI